jgi:hypothetical protein
MSGCYEHDGPDEPSGSIKGEEFLDQLSDCELLKMGFAALSKVKVSALN